MDANDLITRRYYLEVSDEPMFVLFQYLGTRKSKLQFVRPNAIDPKILTDNDTTVFKLPARFAGLVRLQEVDGGRFIVEFEQLPLAVRDGAANLGDPVPICSGPCPPYTVQCPTGTQPDCDEGTLKCK
jgi:hypothetical protein